MPKTSTKATSKKPQSKFNRFFQNEKLVKIFSVVGILVLGLSAFGFTTYNLFNRQADTAQAAIVNGVSLEKVLMINGQEAAQQSLTVGQNATIRIKYNNTNSTSFTNVSIKDQIPTGLSLVANSIKNCYANANCVVLDNNLVANNLLTVAPHSGYFGYANNNTASSSILQFGKMRFLYGIECGLNADGNATWVDNRIYGSGNVANFPAVGCPGGGSTPWANQGEVLSTADKSSSYTRINLDGQRYLYEIECGRVSPTWIDNRIYGSGNTVSFPAVGCPGGGSTPWTNQGEALSTAAKSSSYTRVDTLDQRYIYEIECGRVSPTWIDNRIYGSGNVANFPAVGCPGGGSTPWTNQGEALSTAAKSSSYTRVDTLDAARGFGYIEYRIKADVAGTYNPQVEMTGSFSSTPLTASTSLTATGLTQTLTPPDFPNIGTGNSNDPFVDLNCGTSNSVVAATPTTCTGTLKPGYSIPTDFQLGVGTDPGGSCTQTAQTVTCTNVPVTNTTGSQPLKARTGGVTGDTAKNITVVAPQGDTCSQTRPCILFENEIVFNPSKANPPKFGQQDLRLSIVSTAITSEIESCTISTRVYGSNNSYTNIKEATASTNSLCSGLLTKQAQVDPKWDFEVKIKTTDGKYYQANPSYFLKYGAIGLVTISAVPV